VVHSVPSPSPWIPTPAAPLPGHCRSLLSQAGTGPGEPRFRRDRGWLGLERRLPRWTRSRRRRLADRLDVATFAAAGWVSSEFSRASACRCDDAMNLPTYQLASAPDSRLPTEAFRAERFVSSWRSPWTSPFRRAKPAGQEPSHRRRFRRRRMTSGLPSVNGHLRNRRT
jgi:hypothetical protein